MRKIFAATLLLLATGIITGSHALSQPSKKDMMAPPPPSPTKKFYLGSSMDGAIFSTATVQRPGYSNALGTLRFSYFINLGVTFNYNFNSHTGVYAGIDLKNVGFIEKRADTTIKHRTYNLGIPIGLKFGNMRDRSYFFLGAGCDAPINYREKEFIKRGDKQKFNEWFSDRTPALMPYVFAGVSMAPGLTLKLQYYLNNYMNPDFTTAENSPIGSLIKPYAGYDVHLMLLSLGINVPYHHPHHDNKKKAEIKDKV